MGVGSEGEEQRGGGGHRPKLVNMASPWHHRPANAWGTSTLIYKKKKLYGQVISRHNLSSPDAIIPLNIGKQTSRDHIRRSEGRGTGREGFFPDQLIAHVRSPVRTDGSKRAHFPCDHSSFTTCNVFRFESNVFCPSNWSCSHPGPMLAFQTVGYAVGCVSDERHGLAVKMKADIDENMALFNSVKKLSQRWRDILDLPGTSNPNTMSARDVLCNPNVRIQDIAERVKEFDHLRHCSRQLLERLEIEVKYSTEIIDQLSEIEQVRRDEQLLLPDNLDYFSLNMANDAKNKLADARPASIAAASRIPGITPAAIVILLNHVKHEARKAGLKN
ncbi:Mitochondrial Translation Optimization [Bulinus truncatus]|nr:Mitochondrial Translation Optimization [Bulinus truncatus]